MTGGVPTLCFATSQQNHDRSANSHKYGPTSQVIFPGYLAILVVSSNPFFVVTPPIPPSFTDNVGNIYTLAVGNVGTANAGATAIYYCVNPVYVPIGSYFNIDDPNFSEAVIQVYQVPGFAGAVLDQTASGASTPSGGVTLTTGSLTSANEFVFAIANVGRNTGSSATVPYTPPAGWQNVAPPNLFAVSPTSVTAVTSSGPVTYNPTWSTGIALSTSDATTLIVTFKTFTRAILAPSYWALMPSFPMHTAAYGISPLCWDNCIPFVNFNFWVASICPASRASAGGAAGQLNQQAWATVRMSGSPGNPIIITFGNIFARLNHGGMISFSPNGQLPAPIVAGKRYYIQYGSVNLDGTNTIRVSETSIFLSTNSGGQNMSPKGAPLLVPSGGLVQSGALCVVGLGAITGGSGYVDNIYLSVPLTGGSGTGAVADITVSGGSVTDVSFTTRGGTGYRTGDVVSASRSSLGGGSGTNFSVPVNEISHQYSTYGDAWTDIVLDPGIYYASNFQSPGVGCGLRKWRLFAYGASFQTPPFFCSVAWNDINANTAGSTLAFQTQFKTTDMSLGVFPSSVTLLTGNAALAANFYVNSWVLLQCSETMGQNVLTNWNNMTFEFKRVKSVDVSTGVITFYEQLFNNYRSTLPAFFGSQLGYSGKTGPASIIQLSELFDQEIEIHGLGIYGTTELQFNSVYSVKMVDCEVYGYGFKTGPFPSTQAKFIMEKCKVHNAGMEVDKVIDQLHFVDCEYDFDSWLIISSATVNKMLVDRCRFAASVSANSIGGTPKTLVIRDSEIGGLMTFGPTLGACESAVIINSTMTSISTSNQGGSYLTLPLPGMSFVLANGIGTIKIAPGTAGWFGSGTPSGNPTLGWNTPGARVAVCALGVGDNNMPIRPSDTNMGMIAGFTVLDSYVDGSDNFCVDTDLQTLPFTDITFSATVSGSTVTVTSITPTNAVLLYAMTVTGGGLAAGTTITDGPKIPASAGSGSNLGTFTLSHPPTPTGGSVTFHAQAPMIFLAHPCPRLTMMACSGGRFAGDQSGSPSDAALYSYFKRTFSGGDLGIHPGLTSMPLCGNLVSCEINVSRPYVGTGAGTCKISMFGYGKTSGNYYPLYVTQLVDLKTPGIRTVTAAGGTGLGADAFVAVPFFLTGGHALVVSANAGGAEQFATFMITARAYQGIEGSSLATIAHSGFDVLADMTSTAQTPLPETNSSFHATGISTAQAAASTSTSAFHAAGTSLAHATSSTFDPTSLFGALDGGGWWDPSDFSTMWLDTGRTSPVLPATAGQLVAAIDDKSGKSTNLASGGPPTLKTDGSGHWWLEFDGVANRMGTTGFGTGVFNYPATRINAIQQLTWVSGASLLDVYSGGDWVLQQHGASPGINDESAGAFLSVTNNANCTLGANHVVVEVINGASSQLIVDHSSPTTGTLGPSTGSASGMTVANSNFSSNFSSMRWYGGIWISRVLTPTEIANCQTFFGLKAGLSL